MNYPTLTLSLSLEFFSKVVHSWYLHRKCDCRNKNICCIIVHRHTAKAEMRSFPHKEWENVCLQESQQHPYLRLLSWFEHIKCWNNTINELPRAATTDTVLSLLLSFFHSHISLRSCLSLSLPSEPNQNHTGKYLSNLLLNIVYNPWPPSYSLVIIYTTNFART